MSSLYAATAYRTPLVPQVFGTHSDGHNRHLFNNEADHSALITSQSGLPHLREYTAFSAQGQDDDVIQFSYLRHGRQEIGAVSKEHTPALHLIVSRAREIRLVMAQGEQEGYETVWSSDALPAMNQYEQFSHDGEFKNVIRFSYRHNGQRRHAAVYRDASTDLYSEVSYSRSAYDTVSPSLRDVHVPTMSDADLLADFSQYTGFITLNQRHDTIRCELPDRDGHIQKHIMGKKITPDLCSTMLAQHLS